MYTIINVQCVDQQLSVVSAPSVASGGVNETIVKFSFCPLWDGFAKTAVFWMDETSPYRVLIDINGECVVPPEVTAKDGRMFFGVFGVNGETKRTSTVLGYTVKKGVTVEGIEPDPTQSIYEQILAEHAETQRYYSEVVDDVTSAKDAAEVAAQSAVEARNDVAAAKERANAAYLVASEAIPKSQIGNAEGVAPLDEFGYISHTYIGFINDETGVINEGSIPTNYRTMWVEGSWVENNTDIVVSLRETFENIDFWYSYGVRDIRIFVGDRNYFMNTRGTLNGVGYFLFTTRLLKGESVLIIYEDGKNTDTIPSEFLEQPEQEDLYFKSTLIAFDDGTFGSSKTSREIYAAWLDNHVCVMQYEGSNNTELFNLTAAANDVCMFERTRFTNVSETTKDGSCCIDQLLVYNSGKVRRQQYNMQASVLVVQPA